MTKLMGCHTCDYVSLRKKTETLNKKTDPSVGFEEANSCTGDSPWRGPRGRETQAVIRDWRWPPAGKQQGPPIASWPGSTFSPSWASRWKISSASTSVAAPRDSEQRARSRSGLLSRRNSTAVTVWCRPRGWGCSLGSSGEGGKVAQWSHWTAGWGCCLPTLASRDWISRISRGTRGLL